MAPLREAIDAAVFSTPRFPVASNVTGNLVDDPAELARSLDAPRVSPVRWESARACRPPGRRLRRGRPGRRARPSWRSGSCREPLRWRSAPRGGRSDVGRPHCAGHPARPVSSLPDGVAGRYPRRVTPTRHDHGGRAPSCPTAVVPNSRFESLIDTSDEWIRSAPGSTTPLRRRRQTTSDLAVDAGTRGARRRRHRGRAGRPDRLRDALRRHAVPLDRGVGAAQARSTCPAFDVNAACAGFSYAMSTATAFVSRAWPTPCW